VAPEPIRQRLPYKSDYAARDEANRKLGRAAHCSIGHALPSIRLSARSAGLTLFNRCALIQTAPTTTRPALSSSPAIRCCSTRPTSCSYLGATARPKLSVLQDDPRSVALEVCWVASPRYGLIMVVLAKPGEVICNGRLLIVSWLRRKDLVWISVARPSIRSAPQGANAVP